jgi:thiol-disulfide isomerase/thioredoxin
MSSRDFTRPLSLPPGSSMKEQTPMTRRNWLWTGLGLALLTVACGSSLWAKPLFRKEAPPKPIAWQSDLYAAHKLSLKTNRPMMIVFGASWCGYCRKLEHEISSDAKLVDQINGDFIPVHLDFESDQRIATILEVRSLPTTVILSPDADLLGSVVGYVRRNEYQKALQSATERYESLQSGTPAVVRMN